MAAGASCGIGVGAHVHRQLTRSLERILDDATLSGELSLSGRKLKDFPNTGNYDLADTVIADLSKNRFGEVPSEVTAFLFLERLFLYHNAIRTIPDTIGVLQSLSYLDLSRNQLSEVPRELCQLPLQVLLLSNNKLTSLPKEIGKMTLLTELDASGNQIAQLPMTIGDLFNLRALNLRNNQLGLLPLQITYLQLEILDISCNCISSLPMELRQMSSLVTLNLEHNPLVFPPAMVCVRGRIHIFKYLENQANKDNVPKRTDESRKSGKSTTAHAPYIHNQIANTLISEGLRHKNRYNVDSGYSTSDGGEKRWSSDGIVIEDVNVVPIGGQGSGRSTPSTPSTISPGPSQLTRATSLLSETTPVNPISGSNISPDGLNMFNGDEKSKLTATQQTYKQYKEALRQQRQQDVYRPRGEQISPPSTTPSTINSSYSTPHSPVANGYHKNTSSNLSQNSPTHTSFSAHSTPKRFSPNDTYQTNGSHLDNYGKNEESPSKRPIQKVIPSRSTNKNSYSPTGIPVSNSSNSFLQTNGNSVLDYTSQDKNGTQDGNYIKPLSPIKGSSSFMSHNNVPVSKSNSLGRNYKTSPTENNGTMAEQVFSNGSPKLSANTLGNTKPHNANPMRINWNKDMLPDKLSFTMKREFDRAKEELELIQQLRTIIENRLKMSLPSDLAPALADGVVLCHLTNNVRPRSVASVHVPSATQPRLTMARCRRNVDNFLEACRKIGVEEKLICCAADVLEGKGIVQVAITVTELHRKNFNSSKGSMDSERRPSPHSPIITSTANSQARLPY